MKEKTEWTGKRSVPINQFTNFELNDSISRLQNSIEKCEKRNDPTLNSVISALNNLMAQLVAERANRIGKEG
jgi:hypothetical protein